MIYKFVKWDVRPLDDMKETTPYKLHAKLENGEELTREEKLRLVFQGHADMKLHGWAFIFREWLTEYWVKLRDYGIVTVYAPDKTSIRKCGRFQGIIKIVEA